MAEAEGCAIKLVQCKTSQEMWRYSAILRAMVDKYGQWQRARQGEHEHQKRRAELKQQNEVVGGQLGWDASNMNEQHIVSGQSLIDADGTKEQQVWTVHGIEF